MNTDTKSIVAGARFDWVFRGAAERAMTPFSEGAAVGPIPPVCVGRFGWAVLGGTTGGNRRGEHLECARFTWLRPAGKVWVMPFVEAKPERQALWVSFRELCVRREEKTAVFWQEAAQNGWWILARWLDELNVFGGEEGRGEVELDSLGADRDAASVLACEPLILAVEDRGVRAGLDGVQEIVVGSAWLAMQVASEDVKAVLKRIESRSSGRVGTKRFDDHEPVDGTPEDGQPHVSRVHVAVVEHWKTEARGTRVQLIENFLRLLHRRGVGELALGCKAGP